MHLKKSLVLSLAFLICFLLIIFAFRFRVKRLVMDKLVKSGIVEPNISGLEYKTISFEPIKNPSKVPPFLLRSSTGDNIDLFELQDKVIFLNFWATWCAPCVAEMPSINALYNKVKNNSSIQFITIDIDKDLNKTEKYMKQKKYNLPFWEPVNEIPNVLYDNKTPTTIIINKEGEIVFKNQEIADYNSIKMENFLLDLSTK